MSAIEFALILPLLLALCLGMFEASEVIRADMKLRRASRTLADLVASQSSVDGTSFTDFCAAAKLVMAPYATAPLGAAVASVSNGGGGAAVDWQDSSCGTGAVIANAAALGATMVPNAGDSVIVVSATYRYTAPEAHILPSAITLTEKAYARPRTNAAIPHS